MDIRNVGKNGSVERSGDQAKRAQPKANDVLIPTVARDQASISKKGRATAASVENLAARARRDEGDRQAIVATALQRLQSGELDGAGVFESIAQRLLDAKFLSG